MNSSGGIYPDYDPPPYDVASSPSANIRIQHHTSSFSIHESHHPPAQEIAPPTTYSHPHSMESIEYQYLPQGLTIGTPSITTEYFRDPFWQPDPGTVVDYTF